MQRAMILFLTISFYTTAPLYAQGSTGSQDSTKTEKDTSEAIVVLIDSIKELNSAIFDSTKKVLKSIDEVIYSLDNKQSQIKTKLTSIKTSIEEIKKLSSSINTAVRSLKDTISASSTGKTYQRFQQIDVGVLLLILIFQLVVLYVLRKLYLKTQKNESISTLGSKLEDIEGQLRLLNKQVQKGYQKPASVQQVEPQLSELIRKLDEQKAVLLEQMQSSHKELLKVIKSLSDSLNSIKLSIERQHAYQGYGQATSGHGVTAQPAQQEKTYTPPPATRMPRERQTAPTTFPEQQYVRGDRVKMLKQLVARMGNWHNKSAPEKLRFKKEVEKLGYELLDPYLEGYDTPDKLRKYPYIRFFNIDTSSASTPIVLEPAIIEKTTGKPWKMGKIEGNIW